MDPDMNDNLKNMKTTIRMMHIFQEGAGYSAILITKNDIVKSLGENIYGCLGLGHNNPVQEPTEIKQLNKKDIKNIANGDKFVLALTSTGKTYSWGDNQFGQLGDGTIMNSNRPNLIKRLVGKNIIQISCGSSHCLALTEERDVFAWGNNCYGQAGSKNIQRTPMKVVGLTGRITQVSCGYYHSMALSVVATKRFLKTRVFGWGRNCNGENGLAQLDSNKRIKMNGVKIIKVLCGYAHTFLLSVSGDIYMFGENSRGELGIGNTINQKLPIKVSTKHLNGIKFSDIGAHYRSDVSIAVNKNTGKCLVWGRSNQEIITIPRETEFDSIQETFRVHSGLEITYTPMLFG